MIKLILTSHFTNQDTTSIMLYLLIYSCQPII